MTSPIIDTAGEPSVWMIYFGYDVSAHANANMQFRWCHQVGSGGAFSRGSWNVDDVTVATAECDGGD